MRLTLENSKEIAARMSAELAGEVIAISVTSISQTPDVRRGELDNDPRGWSGGSEKDPLPVKWTEIQLMWSHGGYLYSAGYAEFWRSDIEFPRPGVVTVSITSGAGNRCHWTFIAVDRIGDTE